MAPFNATDEPMQKRGQNIKKNSGDRQLATSNLRRKDANTPVTREINVPAVKGPFGQVQAKQRLPLMFSLTKLTRRLMARIVSGFSEFT